MGGRNSKSDKEEQLKQTAAEQLRQQLLEKELEAQARVSKT